MPNKIILFITARKKMISIAFLSSTFIISVSETYCVFQKQKDFKKELSNFYSLQFERDSGNEDREKVITDLPKNIEKALMFAICILLAIIIIRLKELTQLYDPIEQQKKAKKTNNNQNITKKEGKNPILLILFIFFVFAIVQTTLSLIAIYNDVEIDEKITEKKKNNKDKKNKKMRTGFVVNDELDDETKKKIEEAATKAEEEKRRKKLINDQRNKEFEKEMNEKLKNKKI